MASKGVLCAFIFSFLLGHHAVASMCSGGDSTCDSGEGSGQDAIDLLQAKVALAKSDKDTSVVDASTYAFDKTIEAYNYSTLGSGWCRDASGEYPNNYAKPSITDVQCRKECNANVACQAYDFYEVNNHCRIYGVTILGPRKGWPEFLVGSGGLISKVSLDSRVTCMKKQIEEAYPFHGHCKYGSGDNNVIRAFFRKDAHACRLACRQEPSCTYYAYEECFKCNYPNYPYACVLYTGGPYTYGSGRANTLCYKLEITTSTTTTTDEHYVPGLNGRWFTADEVNMSCEEVCKANGRVFDVVNSKHRGNQAGMKFYPEKLNKKGVFLTVECSSIDNFSNWGASGSTPNGNERHAQCRVNCACKKA